MLSFILALAFAFLNDFEACEHEDSNNCVWNAQEQGNGLGKSFIDIDGKIFYFPSK